MADDLANILRGDIAAWVARAIKRQTDAELRTNAKLPPPFTEELLRALQAASGRPAIISGGGSATVTVISTSWVTAKEAAAQVGLSDRRIRQMAEAGQVRAQKLGPVWQIDIDSLTNVLRRAA